MQSDSDWAGDESTRKSVPAGNIRYGQHLLGSWSKDQTVIAVSSGEAGHGNGTQGSRAGSASRCHENASGCPRGIGIIGRRGLEKVRHRDLGYLWLQTAVRGGQVTLKKVQSKATKVLERDAIDPRLKKLGCVRFDQQSVRNLGRVEDR